MKKITIAILAHVDAGKTTLSEAILYKTGYISQMGRVDKQNAVLDYDSQERKRGITIYSKQSIVDAYNTHMTFIDTPGHVDFSCEMERTLQVLDYAIMIVSARDGIQSHTKTIWNLLKEYQIPTFIFINKMDMALYSQEELLALLHENLDDNIFYHDDAFLENASLLDDALLERYMEEGLNDEDIQQLISHRQLVIACTGSAIDATGVDELLQLIDRYSIEPHYYSETSGIVYKKNTDKNQKLTHIKLTGGSISVKDTILDHKIHEMRLYTGQGYKQIDTAAAGDIIACTGLDDVLIDTVFGQEKAKQTHLLQPFMYYTIEFLDKVDHQKAIASLLELKKEDPSLEMEYDSNLQELHVKVMGEVQIEILKQMIYDRFNYRIELTQGRIAYLETIEDTVEGVGHFEPLRHYAEVHIVLEPAPRGSGLTFINRCTRDTLPIQYQNQVMTHMQEIQHPGVLTGSYITDMKLILVSGRAHLKHTEGGDFKEATYRAIRHGLKKAKSILLEPYYAFDINVSQDLSSKIIYDLDSFQATYTIDYNGEFVSIKGQGPAKSLMNYQLDFMTHTKGSGQILLTPASYQQAQNEEEIIQSINYDSESDVYHPTGSIFCAHGAGYYVPYDEVEEHMHLPLTYKPVVVQRRVENTYKVSDKELEEIFIRTYGPIKRRLSSDMKKTKDYVHQEKVTLLPECLIVDGYNVIFSWDELNELARESLDHARVRLLDILNNYQGYRQCLMIVVFDAYKVKKNTGTIEKNDNLYVVYTKEAQTADNYIESVTHDLASHYRVYVATSDNLEQTIVFSKGAMRISSRELKMFVESTHEQGIAEFNRKNKQMKNYLLEDIKKEGVKK